MRRNPYVQAVADPGFSMGRQPMSEAITYYLALFWPKLHENEKKKLTVRAARDARSLDPPLTSPQIDIFYGISGATIFAMVHQEPFLAGAPESKSKTLLLLNFHLIFICS